MAINTQSTGASPPSLSSVPDASIEGLKRRLERIAALMGSVNALAKTAAIPQSTIRKYFSRGDAPSTAIIALAKAASVRPEWLLTGNEPMWLETPTGAEKPATDDVVFVPLYIARGKATSTMIPDGLLETMDYLPLKRSWLRRHVEIASEELGFLYVGGDSMEPTLRADDMVLMDLADTRVREGLYALIRSQELMLKRLQFGRSNQLRIVSENKSYKPVQVPTSEIGNELKIVGRVVWVGRRMF